MRVRVICKVYLHACSITPCLIPVYRVDKCEKSFFFYDTYELKRMVYTRRNPQLFSATTFCWKATITDISKELRIERKRDRDKKKETFLHVRGVRKSNGMEKKREKEKNNEILCITNR